MRAQRYLVPLVIVWVGVVPATVAAAASGGSQVHSRTQWQVVRSPGGTAAVLAGTSFVSASDGWAVGSTGRSLTGEGIDPLVEHFDGRSWRVSRAPAVPESDEALTGVSAASSTDAWAVGWQDPYGTKPVSALLLHWDGKAWSLAHGPAGAGIVSTVDAVAPDDVWAGGVDLVEHFDGRRWTVVTPPRASFDALGMAATSADDVWLVGTRPVDRPGYRRGVPYAAHWNGVSWSSVPLPSRRPDSGLAAVSAVSPTDVWAVGSLGSDPSTPLALHFDGTTWQRVAVPGAGEGSELSGISMSATDDGWAVGSQDGRRHDGFAVERTFTVHWDGSSWTVVASRNDSRQDNVLTATAAFSDQVWAVGGDGGTLIEHR